MEIKSSKVKVCDATVMYLSQLKRSDMEKRIAGVFFAGSIIYLIFYLSSIAGLNKALICIEENTIRSSMDETIKSLKEFLGNEKPSQLKDEINSLLQDASVMDSEKDFLAKKDIIGKASLLATKHYESIFRNLNTSNNRFKEWIQEGSYALNAASLFLSRELPIKEQESIDSIMLHSVNEIRTYKQDYMRAHLVQIMNDYLIRT